jgi:hypothetical protein
MKEPVLHAAYSDKWQRHRGWQKAHQPPHASSKNQ